MAKDLSPTRVTHQQQEGHTDEVHHDCCSAAKYHYFFQKTLRRALLPRSEFSSFVVSFVSHLERPAPLGAMASAGVGSGNQHGGVTEAALQRVHSGPRVGGGGEAVGSTHVQQPQHQAHQPLAAGSTASTAGVGSGGGDISSLAGTPATGISPALTPLSPSATTHSSGGGGGGGGPGGGSASPSSTLAPASQPPSPSVLSDTVRAAVVEYMAFHGYTSTLQAFAAETATNPPVPVALPAMTDMGEFCHFLWGRLHSPSNVQAPHIRCSLVSPPGAFSTFARFCDIDTYQACVWDGTGFRFPQVCHRSQMTFCVLTSPLPHAHSIPHP